MYIKCTIKDDTFKNTYKDTKWYKIPTENYKISYESENQNIFNKLNYEFAKQTEYKS